MPKVVDHVSYRKQLLAQCFDLFAGRGYSALTMREIAAALDVSTGTLYHYFPTKEALFQQLVEEVTRQTVFEATARIQPQATLKERLLALFRFLADHEVDLRKQLLVTLDYYQHRKLYGSDAGAVLQAGADLYRRAIRDYVGLPDPATVFLLQCQVHGLLVLRMLHNIDTPFVEQARLCVDLLVDHLRSAAPTGTPPGEKGRPQERQGYAPMTVAPRRIYTTLTSRGLRHDILPMRLYHKAKKLGIWDPREIDLTRDREDWLSIPEGYRERLRRLIIGFQAGEEAVTLDLLPLLLTVAREGRLEEEMFLTTFLWEEAKHTEFFRRVLDEVLQEAGDLHMLAAPPPPSGRDLFAEVLPRDMNRLLTDPSPENQVRASVLYNMIIEGVLAETGYYSYTSMLAPGGMMPGLLQGVQMVKRDESRHIAYGIFLISRLVAEHPELWEVAEKRMHDLFSAVAHNQQENGTPEPVRSYARQQFEKRLARIGRARDLSLEQIYLAEEGEEGG